MSIPFDNLAGQAAPEDSTAHANAMPPSARARLAAEPALRISITLELLLYTAIAVAALVLHLAQLGAAPLNDAEATQALAALRSLDVSVPGEAPVADSPLTYALHVITFTFGGGSNTAARLPVALGAVLLVLAPALWRRYLSPLPSLVISGLLLVSPVVLLAGRTSSPVIWSGLLALVLPWCVLRVVESGRRGWALTASVCAAALVLLAEPAGFLMLAGLGLGLGFAWITNDDPEMDFAGGVRRLLRSWPWRDAGVAAALVVGVIGTGFFLLPEGLTAVGNVLWEGLRGFTVRPSDQPLIFPLWISLRYEPGLLLFGLLAIFQAAREGNFLERTLAGWFLAGIVWSMLYGGASAAHALWLTLPLCALVGLQVTDWIIERTPGYWRAPGWAVYAMLAASAALWLVFGVSMVLLGKRLLLELPAQATDLGVLIKVLTRGIYSSSTTDSGTVDIQGGLVVGSTLAAIQFRFVVNVLIMMLIGVLYFLAVSVWGNRIAWRGLAMGTLAVLLLVGLGLGGRATFQNYDDPREFWFRRPVTPGIDDLRATLHTYSLRGTGTPDLISITAQVPPDGALGWALRDFPNTQFVSGAGAEVTSQAVLVPPSDPEPVFGADYVGKDIVMRREWLRRGTDGQPSPLWRYGLMWLYRSASLDEPVPLDTLMVYIRAEVYGVE